MMKNEQTRYGRRWIFFALLAGIGIAVTALCLLRGGVGNAIEYVITYDRSCRSGPWGELEISSVVIAPPIEFVKEMQTVVLQREWIFPEQTSEQVHDLLLSGPLPRDLAQRYLATASPLNKGTVLVPKDEDVLAMTPEQRYWMYGELGKFEENTAKVEDFRFQGKSLDDWFYGVDLSPRTKELLKKLVFRSGSLLVFSDLPILMDSITNDRERLAVYKALCRERGLMLHLRIADDDDLFALAGYWGEGWRAKDVYPMLESLRRKDGERILDVMHLLPPFARRYLYTYPDLTVYMSMVDCHWTTAHFSMRQIPTETGDPTGRLKNILSGKHVRVKPDQLRYGDIALFSYPDDGNIIHSAVYIAADILFTKNGSGISSPWMLMRTNVVKDYYRRGEIVPDVNYIRRLPTEQGM